MYARVVLHSMTMTIGALLCTASVSATAWAGGGAGAETTCSASSAVCSVSVSKIIDPQIEGSVAPHGRRRPNGPATDREHLLASCRQNYQPAAAGASFHQTGSGAWYLAPCATLAGLSGQIPNGTPFMWVPDAAKTATALQAALRAESLLRLPAPTLSSSPGQDPDVPKVVNLPTWAWVSAPRFAPMSATATLPGVSATVTATPYAVDWAWGDGARSRCMGPGTPYASATGNPTSPSPDCGHIYRSTSVEAPGQRFSVSASIEWRVTWSGAGQSGTLADLTSTTAQAWPVGQIQSVVVG